MPGVVRDHADKCPACTNRMVELLSDGSWRCAGCLTAGQVWPKARRAWWRRDWWKAEPKAKRDLVVLSAPHAVAKTFNVFGNYDAALAAAVKDEMRRVRRRKRTA